MVFLGFFLHSNEFLLEYRLKLAILGQEFDINKLTILGGGGEKYIIDNDNATLTLCLFSYNVPMSLGFPVQHCVQ